MTLDEHFCASFFSFFEAICKDKGKRRTARVATEQHPHRGAMFFAHRHPGQTRDISLRNDGIGHSKRANKNSADPADAVTNEFLSLQIRSFPYHAVPPLRLHNTGSIGPGGICSHLIAVDGRHCRSHRRSSIKQCVESCDVGDCFLGRTPGAPYLARQIS